MQPIQRQSEQYSLASPMYREASRVPPEELRDMLAGPRIQAGLLHHSVSRETPSGDLSLSPRRMDQQVVKTQPMPPKLKPTQLPVIPGAAQGGQTTPQPGSTVQASRRFLADDGDVDPLNRHPAWAQGINRGVGGAARGLGDWIGHPPDAPLLQRDQPAATAGEKNGPAATPTTDPGRQENMNNITNLMMGRGVPNSPPVPVGQPAAQPAAPAAQPQPTLTSQTSQTGNAGGGTNTGGGGGGNTGGGGGGGWTPVTHAPGSLTGTDYKAVSGDTLSGIAQGMGVDVKDLAGANKGPMATGTDVGKNMDLIHPNDVFSRPGGAAATLTSGGGTDSSGAGTAMDMALGKAPPPPAGTSPAAPAPAAAPPPAATAIAPPQIHAYRYRGRSFFVGSQGRQFLADADDGEPKKRYAPLTGDALTNPALNTPTPIVTGTPPTTNEDLKAVQTHTDPGAAAAASSSSPKGGGTSAPTQDLKGAGGAGDSSGLPMNQTRTDTNAQQGGGTSSPTNDLSGAGSSANEKKNLSGGGGSSSGGGGMDFGQIIGPMAGAVMPAVSGAMSALPGLATSFAPALSGIGSGIGSALSGLGHIFGSRCPGSGQYPVANRGSMYRCAACGDWGQIDVLAKVIEHTAQGGMGSSGAGGQGNMGAPGQSAGAPGTGGSGTGNPTSFAGEMNSTGGLIPSAATTTSSDPLTSIFDPSQGAGANMMPTLR